MHKEIMFMVFQCKGFVCSSYILLCNPNFICKNNQCFSLSFIYFLYPLTSLPKMVKPEMPASIEQSKLFVLVTMCWSSFVYQDQQKGNAC